VLSFPQGLQEITQLYEGISRLQKTLQGKIVCFWCAVSSVKIATDANAIITEPDSTELTNRID